MNFMGLGKTERMGLAFGCSVLLHIVLFGLFLLIGSGGGKKAETPPPPVEEKKAEQPAPIADAVDAAAQMDAARAAEEEKARAAKAAARKDDARRSDVKKDDARKPEAAKKPDAKKDDGRKPEVAKKPEAKKPEAAKSAEESDAPQGEWKAYEVRPGDSLTKIAKKCGCTVQELAKVNGLKPTASLNLGQKIKIKASE